jgi:hypothetical protein
MYLFIEIRNSICHIPFIYLIKVGPHWGTCFILSLTPGLAPGVTQICPLRGQANCAILNMPKDFIGVVIRDDRYS